MIFSSDEIKTLLDEIRTLFSFLAIIISLLSFYFTGLNWRQSNRPIIVAYIDIGEADHPYSPYISYNLVVPKVSPREGFSRIT